MGNSHNIDDAELRTDVLVATKTRVSLPHAAPTSAFGIAVDHLLVVGSEIVARDVRKLEADLLKDDEEEDKTLVRLFLFLDNSRRIWKRASKRNSAGIENASRRSSTRSTRTPSATSQRTSRYD